MPSTFAGRFELAMQLLAPTYTDGELDENGDPVVKQGEPLISRVGALQLIMGGENTPDEGQNTPGTAGKRGE